MVDIDEPVDSRALMVSGSYRLAMPRFFLFLAGFVLLVAACSDSEAESVERSGLDDPTSTTEPVVVDPPRGALPATLDRVLVVTRFT